MILNEFEEKPQDGTSHVIFKNSLYEGLLVIPKHGNFVKAAYVKEAIKIVQEINDCKGDS